MRGSAWVTIVALVGLASTASASEPSPFTGEHAAFAYGLGATVSGRVTGLCEAHALVPATAGAPLHLSASEASLHIVDLWSNYTLVGPETGEPLRSDPETDHVQHLVVLEGQDVAITSTPGSYVEVRPWREDAAQRFLLSFEASDLRIGAAARSPVLVPPIAAPPPAPPPVAHGSHVGLARPLEATDGRWDAAGDVSVYLEAAEVRDAAGTHTLAPFRQTTSTDVPGLRRVSDHYTYAWLDLRGAEVALRSAGSTVLCSGLAARVSGSFTAFDAEGYVQTVGHGLGFARQQLSLVGWFDVREEVAGGPDEAAARTSATVDGRFEAVGLDLAIIERRGDAAWTIGVAATAGGLVLTALGAVILYSRIAEDRVLESPERRRLYEAVVADPGIEFARLVERNPMSPTNARYHLKLLERRGLVRIVSVQGRHRFVPAHMDAGRARQALLLAEDEKLRDLVRLLDVADRPASELVEALRRQWGLSRTGGWKVLDRAVRAQLVERLVDRRRVILRRAQ